MEMKKEQLKAAFNNIDVATSALKLNRQEQVVIMDSLKLIKMCIDQFEEKSETVEEKKD